MDHPGVRSSVAESTEEESRNHSGGAAANPFTDYVAGDVLLSIQHVRTDSAAEPSFLIMTQVMELLFKLIHTEAVRIRELLDADDVAGALWTMRRLRREHAFLNTSWDVLSTLSPIEYNEFRGQLGEASGFQSHMYRQLEFVLGNKVPAVLNMHRDPQVRGELRRALDEPSLYDAALRLLWRRGLSVPEACVERDWSAPYREREEVVGAWQAVYAERAKHGDLYELAEALLDLAYDHSQWRNTHVLTVERLLGAKTGTGGTSGVSWLRRVAGHRFFPELWTVRTQL
jgi:tryptophan 2,3-dioxygenase